MDEFTTTARRSLLTRRRLLTTAAAGAGALAVPPFLSSDVWAAIPHQAAEPVHVTIQSPGPGDVTGMGGAFTIVDLQLDAAPRQSDKLVGSPRFIAPADPAFGPGPNPAVPGLVVLFSTTKAFSGPRTNLANLFQLTGVGKVSGNKQVWTTWLVGKPIAGADVDSELTVFVVSGTAPAVVPTDFSTLPIISNVAKVTFHIAGASGIPLAASPVDRWPRNTHKHKGRHHHHRQP